MFALRHKDGTYFKCLTEGPCFTSSLDQAQKFPSREIAEDWKTDIEDTEVEEI